MVAMVVEEERVQEQLEACTGNGRDLIGVYTHQRHMRFSEITLEHKPR